MKKLLVGLMLLSGYQTLAFTCFQQGHEMKEITINEKGYFYEATITEKNGAIKSILVGKQIFSRIGEVYYFYNQEGEQVNFELNHNNYCHARLCPKYTDDHLKVSKTGTLISGEEYEYYNCL